MHLKKYIGFITAVVLLVFTLGCNVVSASPALDTSIPDGFDTEYRGYLNELKQNEYFSQFETGIVFFSSVTNGNITVFISDLSVGEVEAPDYWPYNWGGWCYLGNTASFTCPISQLSVYHFNYVPYADNTIQVIYSDDFYKYGTSRVYTDNGVYRMANFNTGWFCRIKFDNTFAVTGRPYLTGIDLSINETDFFDWLIENDKVSDLPSYLTANKLKSFITFYKSYGGSNKDFIKYIPEWLAHYSISGQTNENINVLKHTMDNLYREYLDSYSWSGYSNSANQAHHRKNVETITTDDDTTLITDNPSDTVDVSILRDILRAIIQFQNTFVNFMERLFAKIDNLDFTNTIVNDGGSDAPIDFSDLYIYDVDAFNNDLADFQADIEDVQSVPMGYISDINQNSLMPENMLEDKSSLIVNVPTITGFTVGGNGSTYSTQTGSYVLRSVDYPWLDTAVQKIKRFASILLILGYLVHLRYRIPELIRGE